MAVTWRRRPLIVALALTTTWLPGACSGTIGQRETGAIGSSGAEAAAIAIDRTASYVTIENRAGLPLVDVNVVLAAANGLSFSTRIPRIESSSKRDVPFADLRGNDGTPFSPRWQRATQINVTASDVVGKKYEVKVPWK